MSDLSKDIIEKFNIPGPRYTSYPTAPEWTKDFPVTAYFDSLTEIGRLNAPISLYIHIPFCESMCYYCGCTVVIRKKNTPEIGDEYLRYIRKELELVAGRIGRRVTLSQFHIGGGTPNFLSNDQLDELMSSVRRHFDIDPDGEIAIEVDPRHITKEKLNHIRRQGFNRVSMGIQDFTAEVQQAINRIQPFEMVREATEQMRELGFHSINFDLIYGLPYQTVLNFESTVEKVITLRPDRIALYSYAHVPWLKSHQTLLPKEAIPSPKEKLDIFVQAKDQLLQNGYTAIAMDHFALSEDRLSKAFLNGTLYRNFMGYTLRPTNDFIGIGMSAIGFAQSRYIQNTKLLNEYYAALDKGTLPVERGLVLSEDDRIRQWVITSVMCRFQIDKKEFENIFGVSFDRYFAAEQQHIAQCCKDELVEINGSTILVSPLGKYFVRNICMGFDRYLTKSSSPASSSAPRFSQTI